MENTRQTRVLEIFFRGLRGEDLSVQKLADECDVSTKSITRSINDLKAFLADHRELVGSTELRYSYGDKCYRLFMDEFLSNKELFALVEVIPPTGQKIRLLRKIPPPNPHRRIQNLKKLPEKQGSFFLLQEQSVLNSKWGRKMTPPTRME